GRDRQEQITLSEVAEAWGIGPLEALLRLSGRIPIKYLGTTAGI
ncbi:uncharacterized protein METZ01_LOCUS194395, partial [marine metagenome]